jgi:hypothetical protein
VISHQILFPHPQFCLILHQKFLTPLVAGTGGTEPPPQGGYPRPVTRALALLIVEVALSATSNDYTGVGRAVREAVGVGLEGARWPLLPEVLATVLTAAQPRCSFGEARVAALRLWGQLLEHELRPTKPPSNRSQYRKKRRQQQQQQQQQQQEQQQEQQDENAAPATAPLRPVEEAAKSEVVAKAVAAQAALLDALAAGAGQQQRLRAVGEREVMRVLKQYPDVLADLYRAALSGPNPSLGLLSVVVAYHSSQKGATVFGGEGGQGVKAELLEVYLRETVQAKSKPSQHVLAGFAPLLAAVTHEDMAAVLVPALEKALKKSPSGVMGAVAALAAQLPLDLSRYVEGLLLPPALRMAKSVEEEPREQAVQLLDAVAGKVADAAAFGTMVTEASNVLLGKSGVLAQWSQRHALASALRGFARGARRQGCLPPVEAAAAAGTALDALVAALGKEAHEGARAEILAGVGEWLGLLGTCQQAGVSVAPGVMEALKKGVSASGSSGAAALLPLLLAVRDALGSSSQLQAQLREALAEPVGRLMKEGAKRVGQGGSSPEAAVALHCLVEMAGGEVDAAEGAKAALTDAGASSWLFAPTQVEALMAPASAEAARSLARLLLLGARRLGVAALLAPPAEGDAAAVQDESLGVRNVRPAALALAALLMHPDRGVRGEAEGLAAHVLQEEPPTSLALLKALWVHADRAAQRMEAAGEATTAADLDESAGGKKAAAATTGTGAPAPQRFAGALLVAVPEGAAADCLPMAMVLAGHPAVAASDRQGAAMLAHLVARMGGAEAVAVEFDAVSVDVSDEVIQALMAPLAAHRVAGHRALGALAHGLGAEGRELLADGVVPAVLMQLQRPDLLALPPLDVAIYLHPTGSVYQVHKLGGGKDGGAGSQQQRRMRTGRRGNVYDPEEEKWEAEYRKKKAEEQQQTGAQGPSPEEQKLLDEEAEVRARVGGLKREAAAGLEALAALSRRAPPFAHVALPEALPALTPLLKGALLGEEAYAALRALASAVEPAAQPVAWDLAAGVRLVSLAEEEETKKQQAALLAKLGDVLSRAVTFLAGLCSHVYREKLAAPTYALLFPVLRAVLTDAAGASSGGLQACYGDALSILAAHAGMEDLSEAPVAGEEVGVGPTEAAILRPLRKPMIEVVLYVLQHHPRSEPEPGGILISLLMGPPLSVGEWAPLLGNGGLLAKEASVRLAVLEAVEAVATGGSAGKASLSGNPLLESRLWLARHDEDEEVAEAGERVWDARGAALSGVYAAPLLVLLAHETRRVRTAAARALAAAVGALPDSATGTLTRLLDLFQANAPEPVKEDARGGAAFLAPPSADGVFAEEVDPEEAAAAEKLKAGARGGVAAALEELGKAKALSPDGPDKHLEVVFPFLLNHGVVDPDEAVRQRMVSAGMALIDAYGSGHAAALLPIFEGVLAAPAGAGEDVRAFDWRREGTVVLMGSTARHLDAADPKVQAIMNRLLDALSTPSGPVQRAVALCMVPLMPACKAQAGDYAARLLQAALKGEDYGTRRGAAYGISALVKGLGIASLKQHGIMPALEAAAASSAPGAKQGALFCFECLCDRLKLLFEPYVIVILPLLLKCFSDPSDHVREAAGMAGKAIMGNLSPHGVKLVLPAILKALDDSAWRSKTAALGLLGAMAYCAPKQLSSCLPQIVPRMTEAFGDTHPRVREAGKGALADIGKVIRNPEIRKLSPLLLSALYDPATHTKEALDGLLSCEFMHSVDAPSLALLMPIIQRGLKDRAADLKRKASLITGNMCAMVADARDLNPYLPIVLPGLKAALTDPIPDVRATTARALGSLMRGMGEEALFDLVPWLIETLQTDASSVERSGGAQGLAQVLVALGDARVKAVLGDVLALKSHPRPAVREGVLWLLSFLPPALGAGFTPYLGDALPVILAGLTDEMEAVREVALRAGQVLVSTHGRHHADALLPSLEAGLFDDSWRIRQSSVQLLGDLLYTIGGTKAVGLAGGSDEDTGPGRGVSRAEVAINTVLGPKRRARILASLYVIRSDTSAVVRQSALQVWKTIVPNTPRVLREVLPTLIELLIGALASDNLDKRTVAGRALGDIVRKLGDQILPEIVPCLRHELRVGDANMRQGVCLGLAEILEVATKKQVEDFASIMVEAIIDALSDPAASVREQAGQAFLAFHKIVGGDAVQKVVPPMLDRLEEEQRVQGEEEGEGRALLGVRELLRARPREVLGYLLPRLTRPPVSVAHARTLEAVAEVTGASLHVHASTLLPLLVGQMVAAEGAREADEAEARRLAALQSCTRTVVTSVESNGLQHLVVDLTKLLEAGDGATRRLGAWAVGELAKGTGADLRPQAPILLKYLIPLLNDAEEAVWAPAVAALRALLERLGVEEALSHLDFMRNVVASVVSDARRRKGGIGDADFALPGLNVAGGLEPFMPAYTQGLLQGTPTQKEVAAAWMGELMELMTPTSLRPYIAKVVGPLIRIASDKTFSPSIKCAILGTTTLLLDKGGVALRGLAPQLQTTFTKALNDPSKAVREKAAVGLGRLVPLSTRIDPLVTELVTGAASSPAGVDVQAAMLKALGQVLAAAGDKASPAVVSKAVDQLGGLLAHEHEPLRRAAAGAVGRVVALLPEEALEKVVKGDLLARSTDGRAAQGKALALGAMLKSGDAKFVPLLDGVLGALTADVSGGVGAEAAPVREAALRALASLVAYAHGQAAASGKVGGYVESLVPSLTAALADGTASSVRKAAAGLVKTIAKVDPAALRPHNVAVIPPLLEGVKDMYVCWLCGVAVVRVSFGGRIGNSFGGGEWTVDGFTRNTTKPTEFNPTQPIDQRSTHPAQPQFTTTHAQQQQKKKKQGHPRQVRVGARAALRPRDPHASRDAQRVCGERPRGAGQVCAGLRAAHPRAPQGRQRR